MTLDAAGSSYNTVLGVFSGPADGLTEVACNDNAGPGVVTSRVSWQARAGETYYIVAGALADHAGGVLRLRLTSD